MDTDGVNRYRWYEWVQVVGASLGGGKAIECRYRLKVWVNTCTGSRDLILLQLVGIGTSYINGYRYCNGA